MYTIKEEPFLLIKGSVFKIIRTADNKPIAGVLSKEDAEKLIVKLEKRGE